jgi:hypothetical protein
VPALVVGLSTTLGASPQQTASDPPVSLERVKEELAKPPAREFKSDLPLQVPVTFKSRVDQRVFVLTLEEALHRDFDLNDLQRQSAEWSSKCCGFDLGQLVDRASDALRARKVRKTREQIAQELAELEAARKKSPAPDVK